MITPATDKPRYRVTTEPDGEFVLVRVDGVGVTEALSPADVELMARDLVCAKLGRSYFSFDLEIVSRQRG